MWRFALTCLCLGCLSLAALAQDNFPDYPESHLGFKVMLSLDAAGLVIDYPTGFYSGRPRNQLYARSLIESIDALPKTLATRVAEIRRVKAPFASKDDITFYASDWRRLFRIAVTEFQGEVRKAGREPQQLLRAIDANLPLTVQIVGLLTHSAGQAGDQRPFSDVPATHWAAKAVKELKDAGILIGYPHHRFRG